MWNKVKVRFQTNFFFQKTLFLITKFRIKYFGDSDVGDIVMLMTL